MDSRTRYFIALRMFRLNCKTWSGLGSTIPESYADYTACFGFWMNSIEDEGDLRVANKNNASAIACVYPIQELAIRDT